MTASPKVAIIGAGISGLTSAKNLKDAGVDFDCFESSDRVGGNWAFRNPNGHSSAYRSLHIDTSRNYLSFKDFPMSDELPDYPHHTQIKTYLDDYTDAFDLRSSIMFENGVEHAHRLPGGGWDLLARDGLTRVYDALVVANGHHWDPRLPDFPGQFSGETIHAHSYIDPTEPLDLRGKRIVVVGIGNSAVDLVSELSQKSWRNTVYISTRSGAWILPKYIFGLTPDKVVRTLPVIPLSWQRRLLRPVPRLLFGSPERFGLPTPNHNFLEAHPTQSAELLMRLGSGDAVAKPNIQRLEGDTVRFVDGSTAEVDVIIYATGYNITFPFFDEEFLCAPDNHLPLYKRILKPGIDDLFFVGFAQSLPTLFPFVECQARLVAAHLAGTYRPPPVDEMLKTIAADERKYVGHFADKPRHTQQVDYWDYERNMRKRELPAGRRRVAKLGSIRLAGRVRQPAPTRTDPVQLGRAVSAANVGPMHTRAGGAPVHIMIEPKNGQLSAHHFPHTCDDLASPGGTPCVVMAHGIGATQDCGLTGFAENMAAAGCHSSPNTIANCCPTGSRTTRSIAAGTNTKRTPSTGSS